MKRTCIPVFKRVERKDLTAQMPHSGIMTPNAPTVERESIYNLCGGSSSPNIFIKSGKIVNEDCMLEADVYIENGIIKEIGNNFTPKVEGGYNIIYARNKLIIPGGIDTHTHFQVPYKGMTSVDDFYAGSKAALAGGTTMIMDFVMDKDSSLVEAYDKWRTWADGHVCCDYGLHVIVTKWNKNIERDMELLTTEKGVNSFKMYMAHEEIELHDKDLLQIFEACSKFGALAMIHAENGDIIAMNQQKLLKRGLTGPEGHLYSRPEEVEAEATNRAIVLANQSNCPLYVVHVMSKSAAEIIAKKKQQGCQVFGEAVAAALGTDGSHYFKQDWQHAAAFVMSPPLRPDPQTPSDLMKFLSSNVLQTTGSDNCTFDSSQKAIGAKDFTKIPNGVNGVEDRMSIIWEKGVMTGLLDPCRFVAITSSNAAKIFNIYPRKGRIQVGSDADIVIWDPYAERTISSQTHHHAVDFNIFEGMKVRGVPKYVISGGKIVVNCGVVNVVQGSGKFVPMEPFSPHVFSCFQEKELFPPPVNRDIPKKSEEKTCHAPKTTFNPCVPSKGPFHSRPLTRCGGRNLHDSTFSLSGEQIDDDEGIRSFKRGKNLPGGFSKSS